MTEIKVTQADRDAAGPYVSCLSDMQDIFEGKADALPVVQAFARHRQESQAELVEALRGAITGLEGAAVTFGRFGAELTPKTYQATVNRAALLAALDQATAIRALLSKLDGLNHQEPNPPQG